DPEIRLTSTWRSRPNDEGAFEDRKGDVLVRTIGAPETGIEFGSRMYWQGDKLIEEWKTQLKDAGQVHGTVTRYLADGGKTLIVETVSSGSSTRQKMVFVRKP